MMGALIVELIFILTQITKFNFVISENVNLKESIVWGPGLDSKFVLPVRYFYIQLVDKNLENITKSVGEDFIKVSILKLEDNQRARSHTQVLDRHDGSYIVRFRLFESYNDLKISILHNNIDIGKSPYILKGPIREESCNCPELQFSKWYKSINCNSTYNQIEFDMNKFDSIDMDELSEKIVNRFNQRYSHSLCHYSIIDNQIYRKCHGEHVGFHMFSDAILLSLMRKVKLPNVEFFMNLGDWPLINKNDEFLPIVSWCGSKDSQDIIIPTYDITESTLEMMGRQSLDLFSVQANTGPKWNEKLNKSFWRGRDSRQERLDLVLLSKEHPSLIDAALTNMFFFREKEHLDKYGPISERVSFYDFFKYKYLINIDGTVAAYRLPYLLAGDSVVLQQESNFYEHFYIDLKPYVHYIPFKRDLSNILETIKWSMENEEKVKDIIKNAQNHVREYLQPHHIFCYYAKFFHSYSKKLKSQVKIRDGMVLVEQNKNPKSCICTKIHSKNEL